MVDVKMTTYEQDSLLDDELVEILTAISIISRRLAKKITAKYQSKEDNNVKELWTDGRDRHGEIQKR